MINEIIQGNALEKLKELEADSIDLIVTDPPYGYSIMNKDWDKAVVPTDTWRQCLRVLKPGAFAFIMSSPRQDVLCKMILNLIDAGFETNFTSIYWTYASGFPKAADVSKLVDKRNEVEREIIGEYRHPRIIEQGKEIDNTWGKISRVGNKHKEIYGLDDRTREETHKITKPATEQAKSLEGAYAGFQPKPAVEVILTVMKPLSEKSYVDQALANKKGITWLDDCRIPYQSEQDKHSDGFQHWPQRKGIHDWNLVKVVQGDRKETVLPRSDHFQEFNPNDKGRFPANLLVEDDVLNDGSVHKSGKMKANTCRSTLTGYTSPMPQYTLNETIGDEGSFSRYFSLDAWAKTLPFLLVPKPAKSEKGEFNRHPTVKSLKLMSYLITMGSREGDTVLDPFCGSGTVLIAAHELHRQYIGIEISPEYCEIARERLRPHKEQKRILEFTDA